MVEGTSFMGLGGPNLVKGATGQTIDGETLGGARTHTEFSGVAHYAVNDADCLGQIREYVARLPRAEGVSHRIVPSRAARPRADRSLRPPPARSPHVLRHAARARLPPR